MPLEILVYGKYDFRYWKNVKNVMILKNSKIIFGKSGTVQSRLKSLNRNRRHGNSMEYFFIFYGNSV